jgi:folate-binding protein YgfZ
MTTPENSPATARLADRGVIRVTGEDGRKLLQDIITNDMALLERQGAIHAGLLTPQGKILFDFFVIAAGDGGLLLETARDKVADLLKRLTLYRLRAKVAFEDASAAFAVTASWGPSLSAPNTSGAIRFTDPRLSELGVRELVPIAAPASRAEEPSAAAAYHAHRIALGVPEGGKDYAFGDAFAHEANFDQLNGVSFTKGCFVGQEVVSRMQNRGTARKRIVPIEASSPLTSGASVNAGSAAIGSVGSVAGSKALALLRLDRVAEAQRKGEPLTAGGIAITVRKPAWATFDIEPPAPAEAQ